MVKSWFCLYIGVFWCKITQYLAPIIHIILFYHHFGVQKMVTELLVNCIILGLKENPIRCGYRKYICFVATFFRELCWLLGRCHFPFPQQFLYFRPLPQGQGAFLLGVSESVLDWGLSSAVRRSFAVFVKPSSYSPSYWMPAAIKLMSSIGVLHSAGVRPRRLNCRVWRHISISSSR